MIQVKPLRSLACARVVQAGLMSAVLLLLGSPSLAQRSDSGEQPQRLQAITLNAGMHNIFAELALTSEQRQMGLMYRRDLAGHQRAAHGKLGIADGSQQGARPAQTEPDPEPTAVGERGQCRVVVEVRRRGVGRHSRVSSSS